MNSLSTPLDGKIFSGGIDGGMNEAVTYLIVIVVVGMVLLAH